MRTTMNIEELHHLVFRTIEEEIGISTENVDLDTKLYKLDVEALLHG